MANHTQFSQFRFITVPVTSVPIPHYSQPPTLALAQPVASTSMIHFHTAIQPQSALTTTAIAQRAFIDNEKKARGLIELGIEEIKQRHFEDGLAHLQEGYNTVPDTRFYTWLMTRWHTLIAGKIRDNILVHVDNRLNRKPNDAFGKFVKALCCVTPDLYFLTLSLMKEILGENPGQSMIKGLLKSVEQMNKRMNKQSYIASNSEQVRKDMSIERFLN